MEQRGEFVEAGQGGADFYVWNYRGPGMHTVADVFITNNGQAACVHAASRTPLVAVDERAKKKWGKYAPLAAGHSFDNDPIGMEATGGFNQGLMEMVERCAAKAETQPGRRLKHSEAIWSARTFGQFWKQALAVRLRNASFESMRLHRSNTSAYRGKITNPHFRHFQRRQQQQQQQHNQKTQQHFQQQHALPGPAHHQPNSTGGQQQRNAAQSRQLQHPGVNNNNTPTAGPDVNETPCMEQQPLTQPMSSTNASEAGSPEQLRTGPPQRGASANHHQRGDAPGGVRVRVGSPEGVSEVGQVTMSQVDRMLGERKGEREGREGFNVGK
jgi:hypothetical protein